VKGDQVLLKHILDSIERIEEYAKAGESSFYSSTMIQDAVIRNIEIIGEATKGLSEGLQNRRPEIQWKQIARMRDFLIHVYFGVKLETVWLAIQDDIPPLRAVVRAEIIS
jgi:uncharacterized protein with HEPN domain